jgi:hypothetical protein
MAIWLFIGALSDPEPARVTYGLSPQDASSSTASTASRGAAPTPAAPDPALSSSSGPTDAASLGGQAGSQPQDAPQEADGPRQAPLEPEETARSRATTPTAPPQEARGVQAPAPAPASRAPAPSPVRTVHQPPPPPPPPVARHCDGSLVARSRVVITGQTASLIGRVTNETGYAVSLSDGYGPSALTFDVDGSRPLLRGDYASPPQMYPSGKQAVIPPGAFLEYRSVALPLIDVSRRWKDADWQPIAQFNEWAVIEHCQQRSVPAVHLVQ